MGKVQRKNNIYVLYRLILMLRLISEEKFVHAQKYADHNVPGGQ